LEEFLQPTSHFNWSVPLWWEERITQLPNFVKRKVVSGGPSVLAASRNDDIAIVEARIQNADGGEGMLSNLIGPQHADYKVFYAEMFRRVFQPALPVAALVNERMKNSALQPGEYSVAHYRAFYGIEYSKMNNKTLEDRAINAVNCASTLYPGHPVYFASDSIHALDAIRLYAEEKNLSIATNQNSKEALHLDYHGGGNQSRAPSEFYETFVDLLIMGSGRCVSYGVGGFGMFARLLSYDTNCSNHYSTRRSITQKCQWQQVP
jgi:hypothetical protein